MPGVPGVSTGAEIAAIAKDRVCCSDHRWGIYF